MIVIISYHSEYLIYGAAFGAAWQASRGRVPEHNGGWSLQRRHGAFR